MHNMLEQIIETKRDEVAALKQSISYHELEAQARAGGAVRDFAGALSDAGGAGYGLIAELKKASPSKGLIRADFDPVALAKAYQKGGACCLSVLTDTTYFQGDDAYLRAVRNAVNLPVLRKDFMIDPIQILQSRALGADCVLLIMAILAPTQAQELEEIARGLGMDVLIEIHEAGELEGALALKSPLIGVNNRNLKTMEISLEIGKALIPQLPPDRLAIAESGLFVPKDLAEMAQIGARGFLIGESLMRCDDVAQATADLLSEPARF